MKNTVRIASGKFRGRIINTPGSKTHPMGERERLALMNMISEYLPGAKVLDAYAGSGALGFEALSRGAKEVLFIDSSAPAKKCILDNMRLLDVQADVILEKLSQFQNNEKFDVVLADPPYDSFKLEEIEYLTGFIKDGGVLALSHPSEAPLLSQMTLEKSRKYAGATISIYVKQ